MMVGPQTCWPARAKQFARRYKQLLAFFMAELDLREGVQEASSHYGRIPLLDKPCNRLACDQEDGFSGSRLECQARQSEGDKQGAEGVSQVWTRCEMNHLNSWRFNK